MVTKNGIVFATSYDAERWARNSFTGNDRFAVVLSSGDKFLGKIVNLVDYAPYIGRDDLIASYRNHESYR